MAAAAAVGLGWFALPALAAPPAGAEDPVCGTSKCTFVSPNGSIDCSISVGVSGAPDSAFCAWSDSERAQTVRLLPNGVLDPCINPAVDLIDRCTAEPLSGPVTLGYGQTAVLGPFTCLAEAQGITCTAAPTGKGFTISSVGILPVVPPPPPPVEAPAAESPAPATPAPATPVTETPVTETPVTEAPPAEGAVQ